MVRITVIGSASSRRTAGRVRVSLSKNLGADIDGAWWPYSASMGSELADLVTAIRPALGEIVDIRINWTADSRVPVLSTMPAVAAAHVGWNCTQRLMSLTGSIASTTILVIPPMTPVQLALMVLRQAAGRAVPDTDHGSVVFEAAQRIVRAAQSEIGTQLIRGHVPRRQTEQLSPASVLVDSVGLLAPQSGFTGIGPLAPAESKDDEEL